MNKTDATALADGFAEVGWPSWAAQLCRGDDGWVALVDVRGTDDGDPLIVSSRDEGGFTIAGDHGDFVEHATGVAGIYVAIDSYLLYAARIAGKAAPR